MSDNSSGLNQPNDFLGFSASLYKWRKALFVIAISSAIISGIIVSPLFTTPLYRSAVIMYPVSGNSISKSLLNENAASKEDILGFGDDAETEQMLQILSSGTLRDKVIRKFNLAEHYGIDSTSRNHLTKLYNRYSSNITFKRTEYMAVKIAVLDKDPQMAADIANSIASLLDTVKNQMQRERAVEGFRIVEAEYNKLQSEILKMEDSLTGLRQKGVHDYETQAEMLNQQLAIEIARGNQKGIDALNAKFKVLAQYGGPYVSLSEALEYEKKQLSYVKSRYEEARVDATQVIPQKFVVESAYKAERKAFPVIWAVVLLSVIGALLTGSLVIFLIEQSGAFLLRIKSMQN